MFLSTSRTEGLGMVIIEAMSFGLPVVSFAHHGGREILEPDQTGLLVPVGDVSAMLKDINLLISNVSLRHEYGEKSLNDTRPLNFLVLFRSGVPSWILCEIDVALKMAYLPVGMEKQLTGIHDSGRIFQK